MSHKMDCLHEERNCANNSTDMVSMIENCRIREGCSDVDNYPPTSEKLEKA
jgi:hypothetical protein